ncbi:SdpI family protein [Anaerosporobacter faecicola]|uniref:SdpI family protein n=1 Tax=Anaerosporobacter faecicola TaxID=2718714 RepID=UPI00143A0CD2|nr:SdpI family protein [Anaerosporobacter faecicola]
MSEEKELQSNKSLLRVEAVAGLLCFIPLIIGCFWYGQLPNRIAIHFNVGNNPDHYASKAFVVFGLPLLLFALYIISCVTERYSNKNRQSEKIQYISRFLVPIISNVVLLIVYVYALGKNVNVGMVAYLLMGFLLIILGNYMPKIRHNNTLGIKIPTTLRSESNWNKTHRLAGYLWIVIGFAFIVFAVLDVTVPFFIGIAIAFLVPIGYSIIIK